MICEYLLIQLTFNIESMNKQATLRPLSRRNTKLKVPVFFVLQVLISNFSKHTVKKCISWEKAQKVWRFTEKVLLLFPQSSLPL